MEIITCLGFGFGVVVDFCPFGFGVVVDFCPFGFCVVFDFCFFDFWDVFDFFPLYLSPGLFSGLTLVA